MRNLEQRNELPTADDLVEPMEKLYSHMATQLMKAVATLGASNATKHAGKGGSAVGQWFTEARCALFGVEHSSTSTNGANWAAQITYAGQSSLGFTTLSLSRSKVGRGRYSA